MCLIGFALEADARFALVFAANRDEYFDRPAEPAAWWRDRPELFGGRDLEGGGTWLLVTRHGAFAAVTNVRQGLADRTAPRSRGELPLLAIEGREAEIRADAQRFGGFNLVAGTLRPSPRLWWISNRAGGECAHAIEPGVHGLANGGFGDPWPKVQSLSFLLQISNFSK
ncbi:MAG: NRDE family protein [Burkholderiales bacterium]|nr:MAG: NRDE family protein [Burkholderiales bacterium]